MRSSKRSLVPFNTFAQQPADHSIDTELTTAWKTLAQSKAALRHIENHLEAGPGTAVLDPVMDSPKKKSSRTVACWDGQNDETGGSSKYRAQSHPNSKKESSRSPLRNATQDSNVRKNHSVEFRDPLASYREASPLPHPSSQPVANTLQTVPGSICLSSSPPSDPQLAHLVYQRGTKDKQTDRDLDSAHSSALLSSEIHYLNNQSPLDSLKTPVKQSHPSSIGVPARQGIKEDRTPKAQFDQTMDCQDLTPCVVAVQCSIRRRDGTPSSSPVSASQRLENLRRHQPDDKLEKLKERIRRQRQHLEEAAQKEKLVGYLEKPVMTAASMNTGGTNHIPTAKVRKVAAAPPAPIYKGFNCIETKIRIPDGKLLKEEDFPNFSRELYSDLARQYTEGTITKEQKGERSKDRRSTKTVRKIHRAPTTSEMNTKPVISPASWREGQKLVKSILGPFPKLPSDDRAQLADRKSRTASRHHSSTEPPLKSNQQSRPKSKERCHSASRGESKSRSTAESRPSSAAQDKNKAGVSTKILSADIRGILDDLQLDCKPDEKEERARQRSRRGSGGRRGRGASVSRTRTPVSAWGTSVAAVSSSRGCRSASPSTRISDSANVANTGQKKRHYDVDTVREYIARQQEERKRRQAEEKKALREETDKKNQRLQDLYRKQREAAKTVSLPCESPVAPVQKRLQETYSQLLLEEAQLSKDTTQTQPAASSRMRPMYQPSGESDKENKRLEPPQSPSSSDRSLNDQPVPPLPRNDRDFGVVSFIQPDCLNPAAWHPAGPSNSVHLLSHLLRLDTSVSPGKVKHTQQQASTPSNMSQSKMFRIEAIKAAASSLSNRLENEARKLAGEKINYGVPTSIDMDTIVAPRPSQAFVDDECWARTQAEDSTADNDVTLRIQRILTSMGHSSLNETALPGAGTFHTNRGQKEKNSTQTKLTNATTFAEIPGHTPNSSVKEKKRLVSGVERIDKLSSQRGIVAAEENQSDIHDTSAGSLSEGPLLSEGSLSEDETSNCVPRPRDCIEAGDYCASQRRDYQGLSEFQEAAKCSALSSAFAQQDTSKAPWEELNKGSPLSVINIFTKNLQSQVKVSERNSPAHSLHSGICPEDAAVYEEDFVSSHSSGASGQLKRSSNLHSVNSHFEELIRRSPYEKPAGFSSQHSSFHSSAHSPHLSSGSTSSSSPQSKYSAQKIGNVSDQSGATLVEDEISSFSTPPKELSFDSRRKSSDTRAANSHKNSHCNDALPSGLSKQSLGLDGKKSPATRPRLASPSGFPDSSSPPGPDGPSEPLRGGSLVDQNFMHAGTSGHYCREETIAPGELQYSPAVLQQRMAVELHYLESIEESVRQLGDVERLMGVSMAQQESASLAQMLKAKQQRHEHDLYELKIKAEREALETKLQLEENRQRVARAHIELQESLAVTQKETLESLQDATTKLMSQQAEAARYTANAARHIKEMTELAQSHITGALAVPAPVIGQHQREEKRSSFAKQQEEKSDSDSFQTEGSSKGIRTNEPESSLNSVSHSDSIPFIRSSLSGADSSSQHNPSHTSGDQKEQGKKEVSELKWRKGGNEQNTQGEAGDASIEEELPTAFNDSVCSDSIPSVVDDKGESTSVITEYSLKFDESMTEDEIEERSFRSLLPSEAHRRETMEKRPRHHEESENSGSQLDKILVSGAHNILKNGSIAFSSGQDSFSQFTMEMVRQYMKDEEVRLQHQSSLLGLRQKALKEKIRTEVEWLEHQKKHLRDKGEDDKMPPIRKKQRGLLMRLQQEQAEIKRLQEANKAARKERQLLLKQQEEIERMRTSTLRLKERLKCAGCEVSAETPMLELPVSEAASPCMRHSDDIRTPSPSPSISGSETSSIMQKLKKMRSQMDEKFLTKREQQLMQRRRHAEELLQWKQRLDKEEAEVRRIEKEALAQWDRDMSESQKKEISDISPISSHLQISEPRTDSEKEYISEGDCSPATPGTSIHTEVQPSQQAQSASVSDSTLASVHSCPANDIQDSSVSASASRQSSSFKDSPIPASPFADGSNKTKMQPQSSSQTTNQDPNQLTDTNVVTQSEPISDQSDIESRIKALKDELKKRKFMAYQLKKEQKKRHKERLKAQEASLLKQLQNYNTYIEKTKAELNKESELVPDTKSFNKDSSSTAEESRIKSPAQWLETHKICDSGKTQMDSSTEPGTKYLPDHVRSTSLMEILSEEDTPSVTPTPAYSSPEGPASGLKSLLSRPSSQRTPSQMNEFVDENIVSDQKSCIEEELDVVSSDKFEDQQSSCLLQLETEDHIESQEKLLTSNDVSQSIRREQPHLSLDQNRQVKTRDSSEEESSRSTNVISKMDLKTSQHPSQSFSNQSCSPHSDASLLRQEKPLKDVKTPSLSADGYNDDFESSGERHRSSKTSQISVFPCETKKSTKEYPERVTQADSQEEEVEEEINEELSEHSDPSKASHESVGLLDLRRQNDDSEYESKNIHSKHSPPISPIRTPLSLVIDEMPGFNIGDRVLVGGVQPGTLRFKGQTRFANGFWAGVELDKPEGSNNGTYDGIAYFNCDECHGIFAPPDKVTHLPDKFEVYADTTEDEDSFSDDFSRKGDHKCKKDKDKGSKQESPKYKHDKTSQSFGFGNKNVTTKSEDQNHDSSNQDISKNDKICLILEDQQQSKYPFSNDKSRDIILDFENSSTPLFTNNKERISLDKSSKRAVATFIEEEDMYAPRPCTPADISNDGRVDKEDQKERVILNTLADELLNSFVKDTVKQFAQIKKVKEQKIEASNQMNGELFENDGKEQIISLEQGDGLPFFLPAEKEELSSPELCNRPESPVLGASGQEELAKRLAELELSRELLDELGDDQDWFDEDFGLSSGREQQRLKQKQIEEEEQAKQGGELERTVSPASEALGRLLPSPDGDQQVKPSPKPAVPLPLPPKLPELPAMVVPHSAIEVEKMVHAAVQEIWVSCGMAKEGTPSLTELQCPLPSQDYLRERAGTQDQEALCIRSYRKAVYDLTWEILQEIYAEDPNVDQPQWVKPRRVISSFFHRVKASGDITKIQEFITAEVLKLYGLAKDQSQKMDWQKMLKFGRKKRDRVDHILVQELHEEEVQWVTYDEDELFVKMQLAESIFDTLLKDTVNVLSVISEKNDKRGDMS